MYAINTFVPAFFGDYSLPSVYITAGKHPCFQAVPTSSLTGRPLLRSTSALAHRLHFFFLTRKISDWTALTWLHSSVRVVARLVLSFTRDHTFLIGRGAFSIFCNYNILETLHGVAVVFTVCL